MPIETDHRRLKSSLLDGSMPVDLRAPIWKLICGVDIKRQQYNTEIYQKLLDEPLPEEDEFCIGKDLARTISGFSDFKLDPLSGKNRLYNVLKAYANFDKEVGYCQGINYLAAFFIVNIEEDEDAFWCLEELLQGRHLWREIFLDDTPRLMGLLTQIELKLKQKCPKVLKHLLTTT
jgi:TBC1 domain family member 10